MNFSYLIADDALAVVVRLTAVASVVTLLIDVTDAVTIGSFNQ